MNLLNLLFGVSNEHTHSLVEQTKTTIKLGDRVLVGHNSGDKSKKEINRRNHKNPETAQYVHPVTGIIIAGRNPFI